MASEPTKPGRKSRGNAQALTGLNKDKITPEVMAALFGYTKAQMDVDPDFRKLFDLAVENNWQGEVGKANFIAALQNTNWYKTNSKSMRDYLLAAADPTNLDFVEKRKDSYEYVRQTAQSLGVGLDQKALDELTTQSMMFGWGDPSNAYELQRSILNNYTPAGEEDQTDYFGDVGANADKLQALAYANGVEYNEGWYNSAAKSIASGLSSEDYWTQKIRQEAGSTFPVFKDQLAMGMNVSDIASPYLKSMSELLEINPAEIKLNDPTIMGALTNYDEKGNPRAMSLGAFRDQLRKDPRWMETDKAQNEIAGITGSVMKMFGLVG